MQFPWQIFVRYISKLTPCLRPVKSFTSCVCVIEYILEFWQCDRIEMQTYVVVLEAGPINSWHEAEI